MVLRGSCDCYNEDQHYEQILTMLDDFFQNRAEMIRLIEESANELDEVHKNVKITKVVTGSTGIAGTVLCLTGFALAIPTAGLSILLTIGGSALAAASGTAYLGSDIAEHILTKSHLKKLDELCQADEANVLKLNDYLKKENEKLQKNSTNEYTLRETASSILGEITSLSNLTCSIVRISQAATLTVNSVKFIGAASAILGTVTLPVQIIDLAANGHALHKKKTSDTSEKLRQLAQKLSTQAANIKKYVDDQQMQLNY
ncbi:unnamed protein product [Rotaria sp. Silwood1]|nr:unnamed protein product [Rotaria sp. Silwood1]